MRNTLKPVAVFLLPVFLAASPAFAQQARVVDGAALHKALADQAAADEAQRAQVREVLDRAEVRQLAASLGLDLADARSAVATLSGGQLAAAAERAGAVDVALAGGASSVTISLTTLLLVLIIVILLAK
ncbi:MAG: PA2779 family protein [Vicinamibacterales bacterium]